MSRIMSSPPCRFDSQNGAGFAKLQLKCLFCWWIKCWAPCPGAGFATSGLVLKGWVTVNWGKGADR